MEGDNNLEHATLEDYNNIDLLDFRLWDELMGLEEEDSSYRSFLGSSSFDNILDENDPPLISLPVHDHTNYDDHNFTNILEHDSSISLPCDLPYYSDHHSLNQYVNIFDFPLPECPHSEQKIYPLMLPDLLNDFESWWNDNLSILANTNEPALEFNGGTVNDVTNIASVAVMDQESVVFVSDEQMRRKRLRRSIMPKSSGLELKEIQKYFHLPIIKAAKELRVGVTLLKKRCRELNIARWPHRKIKSLKCLIDNVKELGMTNETEIEMLEEHKKTMEKVPEFTMTLRTKKLRQACFKANYKRRRLLRSPH